MNWIDYTKQKPTDKEAQYLVYYEMPHSKGTLASPQIAQWDGKMFYMFDWEDGQTIRFKNAKYWMKIEEPSADFADADKIALTWQDIKRIVEIADDTIRKACYEHMSEEEYYTEVLRRFKEDSK